MSFVKSLPRLASKAPFLCLMVCHFECPDIADEFLGQSLKVEPVTGTKIYHNARALQRARDRKATPLRLKFRRAPPSSFNAPAPLRPRVEGGLRPARRGRARPSTWRRVRRLSPRRARRRPEPSRGSAPAPRSQRPPRAARPRGL